MARHRPNAPPSIEGVSPSCVVIPAGVQGTLLDFLKARFPSVAPNEWLARMEAGTVVDTEGIAAHPGDAPVPGRRLYYYRNVAHEPTIPFREVVLWQNDHLLVVDKPHFLPVVPSGHYVQETLLVRLKAKLGLQELSPIHRIDRDTAGLVLFSKRADTRNAYQRLFRQRAVAKTYECIAPWNPNLPWPMHRESHIAESSHFMQQAEVNGPVNAISDIAPLETAEAWARYQLKPHTGKRHQLRVHMAALGLPILNDGIYPVLTPESDLDYAKPLQLLAKAIAFTDPLTGEHREFTSQRALMPLTEIEVKQGPWRR